jgi:hypothetical protein
VLTPVTVPFTPTPVFVPTRPVFTPVTVPFTPTTPVLIPTRPVFSVNNCQQYYPSTTQRTYCRDFNGVYWIVASGTQTTASIATVAAPTPTLPVQNVFSVNNCQQYYPSNAQRTYCRDFNGVYWIVASGTQTTASIATAVAPTQTLFFFSSNACVDTRNGFCRVSALNGGGWYQIATGTQLSSRAIGIADGGTDTCQDVMDGICDDTSTTIPGCFGQDFADCGSLNRRSSQGNVAPAVVTHSETQTGASSLALAVVGGIMVVVALFASGVVLVRHLVNKRVEEYLQARAE